MKKSAFCQEGGFSMHAAVSAGAIPEKRGKFRERAKINGDELDERAFLRYDKE